MAVKLTAVNFTKLRYPQELLLPSSSSVPFSRPRRCCPIKAVKSGGEEVTTSPGVPPPSPTRASSLRRPQNVEGEFFVDRRCIDCDTCRWMAPQIFTRVGEMSAVFKQPVSGDERLNALQALLSCPTSSIHTEKPTPDVLQAQKTFPLPIDEKKIPGIYHCGYHSEKSYGAASYLIIRPDGNILVDSPRYTERLARNIEALGGASYMFLTHMDDVADHAKWSKRLNSERILHTGDVTSDTADVEIKLQGNGPWSLGEDVELIHTPGHTEGSVCLYFKPHKILFSGDHLAKTEFGLSVFERYNRISVPMQLDSVGKLLKLDFEWILPGHGRRVVFSDSREKDRALEKFLQQKYGQSTTERPLPGITHQ